MLTGGAFLKRWMGRRKMKTAPLPAVHAPLSLRASPPAQRARDRSSSPCSAPGGAAALSLQPDWDEQGEQKPQETQGNYPGGLEAKNKQINKKWRSFYGSEKDRSRSRLTHATEAEQFLWGSMVEGNLSQSVVCGLSVEVQTADLTPDLL